MTEKNQPENDLDIQKARQLVEEQNAHRRELCSQELDAVLKKYNCRLVAIPRALSTNLIEMQIGIEAL